jgi:hypothetical protein
MHNYTRLIMIMQETAGGSMLREVWRAVEKTRNKSGRAFAGRNGGREAERGTAPLHISRMIDVHESAPLNFRKAG